MFVKQDVMLVNECRLFVDFTAKIRSVEDKNEPNCDSLPLIQ
jgi:hypothetical protein